MNRSNFLRVLGFLFVFVIGTNQLLFAQLFQEVSVRDLEGMEINYGNAVADYDQDGDLDIFVVAYNSFDANDPKTWSRLLENRGGRFEDATVSAKLGDQYSNAQIKDNKIGASWGDYDNDGYPDLLLLNAGKIQLYHNEKNGTFKDVSATANLTTCDKCVNASGLWWDYDNDGDLDLYISDYQQPNKLFRNDGVGRFEDVSSSTQLADPGGTWCSMPIDVNKDGWLDLYVVNDYGLSRFYINNNGVDFTEATVAYGLQNTGNAMGATIGDFNNDGEFDIYVTNIAEFQTNALFVGQTPSGFLEQAVDLGVGNGHWGWGTKLFDADHDGDEDIYLVNGWGSLTYKNKFFKNMTVEGENGFEDWSAIAACDGNANGMGAEVFDYDDDGDLDILVSNTDSKPYFYKNVGQAANSNWLQINLKGTVSNKSAIGTKVKAAANGKYWVRYFHGAAIMGQSIKPVHFGLGSETKIDSLIIEWPLGLKETYYDIIANQKVTVVENEGLESLITSIPDNKHNNKTIQSMLLYPNPFSTDLHLEINARQQGDLVIQYYSLVGKKIGESIHKIYQPGPWKFQLYREIKQKWNITPGTYLIKAQLGDQVWRNKVIFNPK